MTANLGATEFSHVGIQVRDLRKSLEFYRDRLGMESIAEWYKIDDPSVRAVVNLPDAILNVAILRMPATTSYLEIIEYANVESSPVDTFHANPGTCHIAFYVADLDTVHATLLAAGIQPVSKEVVVLKGGIMDGGKCAYVMDPDGIRVEFIESDRTMEGTPRGAS